MLSQLFLLLFTLNVLNSNQLPNDSKSSRKSVSIGLSSNWLETPLYLEFSEFLAQENNELFWQYIESIDKLLDNKPIESLDYRRQYDLILQLSDLLLASNAMTSVVKYSLSIRSYSPTVIMYNQMANELVVQQNSLKGCEAFVELSRPSDTTESIETFSPFNCGLSRTKTSLEALIVALEQNDLVLIDPNVYKSDHILSTSGSNTRITAILYGQIGTKPFRELHNYLKPLAEKGLIKYVVRHYIQQNNSRKKVSLSGYGVELAIKSTEYKAQDDTRVKGEITSNLSSVEEVNQKPDETEGFVFSKLKDQFPEKSAKLEEFQNYLLDKNKEIPTLKVWELQEISLQATKKILTAEKTNSLNVLREICQNFPTESRNLIKIKVDSEMKKEIERNQQIFLQNLNLGTTDVALFINGLYYDVDTIDVFTLLEVIRKEFKLVEGMHQMIGGNDEKLKKLIKLDISSDKQDFQIDIRDGAVVYINDIENDKMYRNWPSSLQDMLRPTYPGMLRNVRKNMYHLVLVLDPSKQESHDILKLAESFYVHKAPVRIGIVFAVSQDMSLIGTQDAGVAALEAFNFISQDKSPYEGLSFLTDVIATVGADKGLQRDLKPGDVINQFKTKYKNEDLDLIFGEDSDYDTGRKLASDFIHKTGIGKPIKALLNGVILKENHLNAELFEEVVLTEIMKQTTAIQKAIYKGELTDSDDILEWLMTQKSVMPRLNPLILNIDSNSDLVHNYIDFSGKSIDLNRIEVFEDLNLKDFQSSFASSLSYISAKSDKCSSVTVWLASNFQTKTARNMLLSAVSHIRSNSLSMRLSIIHSSFGCVSRVIESAISSITQNNHLLQFLNKFLSFFESFENSIEDSKAIEVANQLIDEKYIKTFKQKFDELTEESLTFKAHKAFSIRSLGIGYNDSVVVLNGKVIRVPHNQSFIEDDFVLIEKYVTNSFADKILSELSSEERQDQNKCSDFVMKISSVLLSKPQSKARHDIRYSDDKYSVLNLEPERPEEPYLELTAIFDPLTRFY